MVTKTDFPLKAYYDLSAFKIYMCDIGLLRRMSDLDSSIVIEGNRLFEEFKGAFTENFVLNMLCCTLESSINYYTFDRHEIDFMIQIKNKIIPIEVKSSESSRNISLTRFNEKFDNDISIRFSLNNLTQNGKVLNIPLFMTEYIENFL